MGRLRSVAIGLVLAGVLAGRGAKAQLRAEPGAYPGVDGQGGTMTVAAALRTMSAQADVVFLGTVVRVTREGAGDDDGGVSPGVVDVVFQVEQAVRGVTGASYTLREWGGLWPAGTKRYQVGERRLMLLHAPSATGLSSPVGGMDGAILVRGLGARVGAETQASGQGVPVADLRWIAAKLVRPVSYRGGPATAAVTGRATEAGESERMLPIGGQREAGAVAVRTETGERTGGTELGGVGRTESVPASEESSPTLVRGVMPAMPGAGPVATQPSLANGTAMAVGDLLTLLRTWSPEARSAQ